MWTVLMRRYVLKHFPFHLPILQGSAHAPFDDVLQFFYQNNMLCYSSGYDHDGEYAQDNAGIYQLPLSVW